MSPFLIILTGLIYAYIALEQSMKGNINMGGMYFGYALSNVFLYRMAL